MVGGCYNADMEVDEAALAVEPELSDEVLTALEVLAAQRHTSDWDAGGKRAFVELMDQHADAVLAAAEKGKLAEELTEALKHALDACENMVDLPLGDDWRDILLEQYPNAREQLRKLS